MEPRMNIAIPARSWNACSTRRLKEAAVQRGHKALGLNTLKFSLTAESGTPGYPTLEGLRLRETDLRSRRIQDISIMRNRTPIPTAGRNTLLKGGDKLLCDGNLLELRARMRRRRKPDRSGETNSLKWSAKTPTR
jgi:hypothetical protein